MEQIHVLFIDDDDSLQLLASAMLNGNFFKIFGAKNTSEADVLLNQKKIDLIVCDVMMPGEDGITFCTRIKKAGCRIPFLILSACGDPKTMTQGLSSGANQYLVKPFDIYELQARMFSMAGRKPPAPLPKKDPQSSTKFLNWFRR